VKCGTNSLTPGSALVPRGIGSSQSKALWAVSVVSLNRLATSMVLARWSFQSTLECDEASLERRFGNLTKPPSCDREGQKPAAVWGLSQLKGAEGQRQRNLSKPYQPTDVGEAIAAKNCVIREWLWRRETAAPS
jgi:hypothetical protein